MFTKATYRKGVISMTHKKSGAEIVLVKVKDGFNLRIIGGTTTINVKAKFKDVLEFIDSLLN